MPFDDAYACVLVPCCCQQSAFCRSTCCYVFQSKLPFLLLVLHRQFGSERQSEAVNLARQKYVCNTEYNFSLNSLGELPEDLKQPGLPPPSPPCASWPCLTIHLPIGGFQSSGLSPSDLVSLMWWAVWKWFLGDGLCLCSKYIPGLSWVNFRTGNQDYLCTILRGHGKRLPREAHVQSFVKS